MSSASDHGQNPDDRSRDLQPSIGVLDHLIHAQQWERLLTMARERIAQQVEDLPGHRSAAIALINLRRTEEAKHHVEWLLQKDPENSFHHVLAAQAAILQADFCQARRILARGLSLAPEDPPLHRLMATVLAVQGKVRKAMAHANKAKELDGGSVESWRTREFILRANSAVHGHWKERIAALEKALQLSPEDPVVLWRVGTLLQDLERPAAALNWLSRSLAAQPTCALLIRDWKEAHERKSFFYRCLSYPWRSLRSFRRYLGAIFYTKPWLLVVHFLALKLWGVVITWWLGTLTFLAPAGWLVRYFIVTHPAFDSRFLPRSWIRTQPLRVRILCMIMTAAIGISLTILLTSDAFVAFCSLLFLAMFALQAACTGLFILVRRLMAPNPPQSWLSFGKSMQ